MRTSILGWAMLAACSGAGNDAAAPPPNTNPPAQQQQLTAATEHEAVAYFAGGCFWGVEHYMEQLDGVINVDSGYMGGHVDNPSYEEVSSHDSGHLETVEVRYDPTKVSYEAVAKLFFEIHDPTQANGQGPDIGPQYLSAVFYNDEEEKQTAEALIDRLEKRGFDVATILRPASKFYRAEDYHQDYYVRHDKLPYCHARVKRFGD